jgi:hypothetical protein
MNPREIGFILEDPNAMNNPAGALIEGRRVVIPTDNHRVKMRALNRASARLERGTTEGFIGFRIATPPRMENQGATQIIYSLQNGDRSGSENMVLASRTESRIRRRACDDMNRPPQLKILQAECHSARSFSTRPRIPRFPTLRTLPALAPMRNTPNNRAILEPHEIGVNVRLQTTLPNWLATTL